MSSDQISEEPLPPEPKRCPKCGTPMAAGAQSCEACQAQFGITEGLPDPVPRAPLEGEEETVGASWPIWVIAGIVVIVTVMAVVANAPGLLCFNMFAALPLIVYSSPRRRVGCAAWLCVFALVIASGFIAFGMLCTSFFNQKYVP